MRAALDSKGTCHHGNDRRLRRLDGGHSGAGPGDGRGDYSSQRRRLSEFRRKERRSGRQRQQACGAVVRAVEKAAPGGVPGEGGYGAVAGRTYEDFGRVGEAAEENESVLVADRNDQGAGMKGDLADLGGAHTRFARRLAHRTVLVAKGPDDASVRARRCEPMAVMRPG